MHLLLIEDDQAYQLAMATHLRQLAGVQQVWVAADGEMGLELLTSRSVDLVLLDLVLPGLGGLATCRQITNKTDLPVLILTSHEESGWVRQIWDAGARGYLHKERALAQVELALASLMVGASWWDQKATAVLQRSGSQQAVAALNQDERLNDLTQREREVLACLAAGDNNRCIAEQLGIGEGTVRSHVHALLQKLQVSNRTQAALIWLTAGEQC
ncbi:MAG: response regulator transcription factor [Cyanobium sp. 49614_E6]|jgi:two-component system NarL family response regulator|nr:response regulator transcription factor [Cyanobium sp. 49614_E6]